MTAGESARQEARRARERAEHLARRAEMFEKGAEGESRTGEVLQGLGAEWTVLHDHRWPGRRFANIDHVVVGPGGIFVIDSKNWSGDVRVGGQVLRQNGRSREKAVASAADAALAVSEIAGPHAHTVRPVICFARDEDISGWARDVMVCSTSNLVPMLRSRPRILEAAQAADAALRLDASLQRAGTASPALSSPDSASGRTRPQRPAARNTGRRPGARPRRSGSSPARLLGVLIGGLLLMLAIPTTLPAVASALSDAFMDQLKPADDECAVISIGASAAEDGKGKRRLPAECR